MEKIKSRFRKGVENPREVPPFLLKKVFGLEPGKFGWQAVPNAVSKSVYRKVPLGKPEWSIWEDEWDLLVIVDSCRPEWLEAVAGEYDWITDVETVHSVGSHSREWTKNTFREEYRTEIEETVYVSGNPYSHLAPCDDFRRFEDINEIDWEVESAAPPAHIVTDCTVEIAREEEWDRCIAHYMQPHKPIFERGGERDEPVVDQRWQPNSDFWRQYIDGHVAKEELDEAFISNLRYVLDEIEVLLENIEAPSVVITSDHGQAMGEEYLWSHREGVQHPSMRRVPRVECSATDKRTLDPEAYVTGQVGAAQRNERLKQLGYL